MRSSPQGRTTVRCVPLATPFTSGPTTASFRSATRHAARYALCGPLRAMQPAVQHVARCAFLGIAERSCGSLCVLVTHFTLCKLLHAPHTC